MSWHRADNNILSVNSLALVGALPSGLGAAAIGYLTTLRAWCSEERTVEIPSAVLLGLGRLLRLNGSTLGRIVSTLAVCGYLEQMGDGGARLLDEAVVRAPAPIVQETGKAARQRRYKERRRQASPGETVGDGGASPGETGRETLGETGGVSRGDGGASPKASPLAFPPPRIPPSLHVHEHEHMHTCEGSPEGGSPSAHTLSPQAGEDAHQSHAKAPSSASGPLPLATAPTATPEAQQGPIPAKPKKPRATRTLPPRKALAAAYAAGISQVTGAPCSPPAERWELDALEAAMATHAPGLAGPEALAWVTSAAKDFAQAKAEDRWTVDRGFPPKMAKAWLDGGNRPPPRPPSPRPKGGPMIRKGPGPSHNWLLDEDEKPIDKSCTFEDLTRDLFAMPADILQEPAQ